MVVGPASVGAANARDPLVSDRSAGLAWWDALAVAGAKVLAMSVALLTWPEARNALEFGNKAANLAVAAQAGLPVPPGVAIGHALVEWEQAARPLVGQLRPPLAVRSSSLAEDSPRRAFPGVFETVLGVMPGHQMTEAIDRVRASGSGDNVRAYLSGDVSHVQMGVLIQELVKAAAAGVAFSRDPVTAARTIIVESNLGLGKTVVDGEVTPDTHELTHELDLIRRQLGRKRVRADYLGELIVSAVPPSDSACFAVSDAQAREIGRLVLAAEAALGVAVDVEWAIDGSGSLWLLQARPITTLATQGATL